MNTMFSNSKLKYFVNFSRSFTIQDLRKMEITFTESLARLCGANVAATYTDILLKHCIL